MRAMGRGAVMRIQTSSGEEDTGNGFRGCGGNSEQSFGMARLGD